MRLNSAKFLVNQAEHFLNWVGMFSLLIMEPPVLDKSSLLPIQVQFFHSDFQNAFAFLCMIVVVLVLAKCIMNACVLDFMRTKMPREHQLFLLVFHFAFHV